VAGTDTNYCDGVDSVQVTVFANPDKPTITRDGDELVSSSDANNQWYYKGLKIQAGTGQRFPLSAEGDYTVSVTNEHGCSTLSDPYNYKKTGSGVVEAQSGLQINIVDHSCTISTDVPTELRVDILDVLGRVVAPMIHAAAEGSMRLPIPELPAGTYFLRAESPRKTITLKFIER
jgi:hypothetical protein